MKSKLKSKLNGVWQAFCAKSGKSDSPKYPSGFVFLVIFSGLFLLGATPPLKHAAPSRPKISTFKNWGLENIQDQSHIDAIQAWKIQKGSPNIVVAIIDTGIDPNHKDLSKNLWRDPAQKNQRVYGWDFIANKPNPIDDHGHGTNVSGIIGAISNPHEGISGVAPHISLMAIKYYAETNSGATNLKNTIAAIHYAIDHGAKIINYSGGGPQYSELEFQAMKRAQRENVLVVAAAGNDRQNTDVKENYYYPAAYHLPNIITVAATDIHNNLLPSSNWGKGVDVAAPGENIYSTLPHNKYGPMTGTSQATAFVSGVAALMLAEDPTLKPAKIRELIMQSADPFPKFLAAKVSSEGRVNAFKALLAVKENAKKPWDEFANSTSLKRPLNLMHGFSGYPLQLVF